MISRAFAFASIFLPILISFGRASLMRLLMRSRVRRAIPRRFKIIFTGVPTDWTFQPAKDHLLEVAVRSGGHRTDRDGHQRCPDISRGRSMSFLGSFVIAVNRRESRSDFLSSAGDAVPGANRNAACFLYDQ